jgi:hypothetical protein
VKAAADAAERRSKGIRETKPRVPIDPTRASKASPRRGRAAKAPAAAPPRGPTRYPIVSPGRPTKYKEGYAEVARAMCRLGATDAELAAEFGVDTSTIWRWQSRHESFCNALKLQKGDFDERIVRSLAQRAAGYSYVATKVYLHEGRPVVVEYEEHVPPDPGAAKLWLTNRRPEEWRDKQEHELSGGPITVKIVD